MEHNDLVAFSTLGSRGLFESRPDRFQKIKKPCKSVTCRAFLLALVGTGPKKDIFAHTMRFSAFTLLIFPLLLAARPACAQPGQFGISMDELSPDSLNLSGFAGYFCDSTGRLDVRQVYALDAHFFQNLPDTLRLEMGEHISHWAIFQISNRTGDPLSLFLSHSGSIDFMRLYHWPIVDENNPPNNAALPPLAQIDSLTCGRSAPYSVLPYWENQYAIPIHLKAGEKRQYLCQLRHFWYKRSRGAQGHLLLGTVEWEEKAVAKQRSQDSTKLIFFISFFAALLFLLALAIMQYISLRSKPYLFYAIYLVFIILYFLRNFETSGLLHSPTIFDFFRPYNYLLEVPLGYASYVFYILFLGHFMDFSGGLRRMANFLLKFAVVFAVLIPIHIIIIEVWGIEWNAIIHAKTRVPFFVASAIFMGMLVWKSRSLLNVLILTGTTALLLGAFMTLSDEIFGGILQDHPNGIWGWFVNKHGRPVYPFYNFKVGVLFEVLCFSAALTLKARQLKQEHHAALLSLGQMHEEKERLREELVSAANDKAANGRREPPPEAIEEHDFLKHARQQVEAHLDEEDFGRDELAKAMIVSRDQLYRKMKLFASVTPYEFIKATRLHKARALLRNTELRVSEVAGMVGFKNAAHFSTAFKQMFGEPPKQRL